MNVFKRKSTNDVYWQITKLVDKIVSAPKSEKIDIANSCKMFVYAIVNIIANDCANTKLRLFSKNNNIKNAREVDKKTKQYVQKNYNASDFVEVYDHPAINLIREVNDYEDENGLRSLTEQHLLIFGNAFWYIVKSATGQPVEIHLLQSDQVEIIPDEKAFRSIKKYKYNNIEYDPNEIIHFKYPNPNSWLYGASPLQACIDLHKTSINLVNLLYELSGNKNGTDIYIKLGSEGINLTQQQKEYIKDQFKKYRTGNIFANEVMILDKNSEIMAIPNSNKDLPFIENLRGLFRFICWIFGVPEAMFMTDSSNRAVQGVTRQQYYENVIATKLARMASVLNAKYLPMFNEAKEYGLFFAFDDPMPQDPADIIRQVQAGIMTPNEARKLINLDTIAGADVLLINNNIIPFISIEKQSEILVKTIKEMLKL